MHLDKLNRVQVEVAAVLFGICFCLTIIGCNNDSCEQSLYKENDGTYQLNLSGKDVDDLSEFSQIPVSTLVISNTSVTDLTPFKGAPLQEIGIYNSPIKDLRPISTSTLRHLCIIGTDIQSLLPLRETPLVSLQMHDPFITNGICEVFLVNTLIAINHQPAWDAIRSHRVTKMLSADDVQLLSVLDEKDLDHRVADDSLAFVEEYQGVARRLMLCEWEALSDKQHQIASAIVNNVGTGFVRLNQPRLGFLFLSFMVEQSPNCAASHGNLAGALKLICFLEGENRTVYERALAEYRIALDLEGEYSPSKGTLMNNIEFIETRLKEMNTKTTSSH